MRKADHILIVGEDSEIGSDLPQHLQRNGYSASLATGSDAMWAAFDSAVPDVVLLDIPMSGSDGLTLCRELRAHAAVPVIMLGRDRYGGACIAGLETGADDYVVKPLNPRELLARIQTVLRRSRASRRDDPKTAAPAAVRS